MRRRLLQAEAKRRLELNPLQWIQLGNDHIVPLTPTPKQLDALARAPYRKIFGFFGGNRAGKSVFALFDVCSLALGVPWQRWPLLPPDPATWALGPPRRIWCVTISYEKSRDGQQEFLWRRIPRKLWKDSWWKTKKGFHGNVATLRNGTTFYFKTAEQDIHTFETVAIDMAWFDETIPRPFFEATLPRLVDRNGRLIWTTIPDDPFIDDLFVQRQLDPSTKSAISPEDIDAVWGEMGDNPHIDKRQIALLESTLDPIQREIRIYGRFAYRSGLIYGDYDDRLHIEAIDPPLTAEQFNNRAEIIDPGWDNPCAVVFGFLDPAGVRHVYDEIYVRRRTVGQIAAMIYLKRWLWRGLLTPREIDEYSQMTGLAAGTTETVESTEELLARNRRAKQIIDAWRSTKGDLPPRVCLADEYGDQKDQAKPVPFRAQLAEFGIKALPARNADLAAKQMAVRELLRPIDGYVRLRIAPRCEWGIYEFKHHQQAAPNEQLRQYTGDKERILDGNNHFLSGIQYWAVHPQRYHPLAGPAVPMASPMGHEAHRLRQSRGTSSWRSRG